MGQQRYIIEDLMKHFVLDEAGAERIMNQVEAITGFGNVLSDAMISLRDEGDLEGTLVDLRFLSRKLNNDILNLQASFTGVEKRRQD